MPDDPPVLAACEWIFGGRPLPRIVATLSSLGYDAIEVVGEPGRPDAGRLERLASRAGLGVSGLTASADRPDRDLAHPDPAMRRSAVGYFCGCVDLALDLGAPCIGVVPSAERRLAPISQYKREWRFAVAAAREVAFYAAERDIAIAVEPLNRYEAFLVNRLGQAADFAAAIGLPNVGIVADLFHMNIEESDPVGALLDANAQVLEIHLADTNRRGLGYGHLTLAPLADALARIRFSGAFVVECMPAAPDPFSVANSPTASEELDRYLAKTAAAAQTLLADSRAEAHP